MTSVNNDYDYWLDRVTNARLPLGDISAEYKTYGLCLADVTNNSWILRHVPDEFKDYNICKVAVTNNGLALRYTPDKFHTLELICIAIDNSPDFDIYRYINLDILTEDDWDYLRLKYGITK